MMKRRQGVQKRNRDGENFKKRWRTLFRKGMEIQHDFDAEVYIYIQGRGKRLILRSTKHCCPPIRDELDKAYPIPIQFTIEEKDDREKLQKKPSSSSGLLEEIAPAAG
ncbi:hypothetical protein F5Y16DRAFT_392916 [Xylariaceae sp. FL0255]|nr:hypothetical protein F5Y16DRAFT_392916 [Xylariaceae sp. FL0255]